MKRKGVCAALAAALILSSCSGSKADKSVSTSSVRDAVTITDSSSQTDINFDTSDYTFDLTEDYVELDGKFYYCYINRPIRFDMQTLSYEEILSYESPYDKYLDLFYDDRDGKYEIMETVAFAIRYAYENDIEYIDFPIEYDTKTLSDAWEYARLSFPNLPLETLMSELKPNSEGYYRIRLTKAVRQIASSDATLIEAEKIISEMPDYDNEVEKAYYLYKWVCENVVYDKYHAGRNEGFINAAPQSAYGALVEKRAVCDGIAGAVQLLFNMADIDCGKVYAYSYKTGGGHAWNVASINGEIWDFDATWDISKNYEDESDEISESFDYGRFLYFGVERSTKTVTYDICDIVTSFGVVTADEYTKKSPAQLSCDCIISKVQGSQLHSYFQDGELVSKIDYDKLLDKVEDGELVTLKFNDIKGMFEEYNNILNNIIPSDGSVLCYYNVDIMLLAIYPSSMVDDTD